MKAFLLGGLLVAATIPAGTAMATELETDAQKLGYLIGMDIGKSLKREQTEVDIDALLEAKTHIESQGLDVLGPVNHGIFKSIYFFDPNGHRIELAAHTGTPEQMQQLHDVAPLMLEEWSQTKRAPQHAAWLHEH